MKSPEYNSVSKNIFSLNTKYNCHLDKKLKLEAIDLLTKFSTCTHDRRTVKAIKIQLAQWQKQSEQHQKAWQDAEKMWQLMADIYPSVNNEFTINNKLTQQKKYWSKILMPTSIAASFLLVFILQNLLNINPQADIALLPQKTVEQVIVKRYQNQWQAQHRVLLPDNSIVHLNFNSSISIHFSDAKREIELHKGEALFKVAKNRQRPFIVKTGNSTASALGTEFIVRRQTDGSSLITVTEGVVKVALSFEQQGTSSLEQQSTANNPITQNSVILTANESVVSSSKAIGAIRKITANNVASWHRGVLIFNDTELHKVLAEINRYTPYNITANLGYRYKEKITGTFFINRLDQELGALITSLNLAVINNKKGELVLGLPRPKFTSYPL